MPDRGRFSDALARSWWYPTLAALALLLMAVCIVNPSVTSLPLQQLYRYIDVGKYDLYVTGLDAITPIGHLGDSLFNVGQLGRPAAWADDFVPVLALPHLIKQAALFLVLAFPAWLSLHYSGFLRPQLLLGAFCVPVIFFFNRAEGLVLLGLALGCSFNIGRLIGRSSLSGELDAGVAGTPAAQSARQSEDAATQALDSDLDEEQVDEQSNETIDDMHTLDLDEVFDEITLVYSSASSSTETASVSPPKLEEEKKSFTACTQTDIIWERSGWYCRTCSKPAKPPLLPGTRPHRARRTRISRTSFEDLQSGEDEAWVLRFGPTEALSWAQGFKVFERSVTTADPEIQFTLKQDNAGRIFLARGELWLAGDGSLVRLGKSGQVFRYVRETGVSLQGSEPS
eukprot:TRINITY_DN52919_c0_g1_i1.p1 TRINITY_DN52919_c0_g1~~TRINITY_DN52919_c0_g1_i1.p1  ORF type:complete len:398 (-),score=62.70 TRINITY_DN52919_c0_g1_i1:64-1257(-)